MGIVFPLKREFDEQVNQLIVGVRSPFSLSRRAAVLPCSWRNFQYEPQVGLRRTIRPWIHSCKKTF